MVAISDIWFVFANAISNQNYSSNNRGHSLAASGQQGECSVIERCRQESMVRLLRIEFAGALYHVTS